MTDWITPLLSGAAVVIAAVGTAWVLMRKANAEVRKTARNGVIEEWREITNRCEARCDEREEEIKGLRGEVNALKIESSNLKIELAELRKQIAARETERVQQRGEIRELEKIVTEIEKPDTEALAEAVVAKLADSSLIAKQPEAGAGNILDGDKVTVKKDG